LYAGISRAERKKRAAEALKKTGLEKYVNSLPNRLSGGQQQRVAIARALVNNPELILADEPTGNLDTQTSADIMNLFKKLNGDAGMTIVVVTHEPDIAAYSKRMIRFRDGRVVHDGGVGMDEESLSA
ncbi:MAG: ATP-binding cassette domain-containing protein, partial [Burkholderiales bacterium]